MVELEARLGELVLATPWLVRILEAARAVDAWDWLVAAGAIRTLVWDHLAAGRRQVCWS
jgi:uncharacterized protein